MAEPSWPQRPLIYEVPTWSWCSGLSRRLGRDLDLGTVPQEVLAEEFGGFDAVWAMGVWERSPAGRALNLADDGLREASRRILPDLTDADVVGSPYAVHDYRVDPHLGGEAGLAKFRARLARRGLKLILDYVPNHLARDHAWTASAPEIFIRAAAAERKARPNEFFSVGRRVFAHGRDPYFPPWADTVQIDAFSPQARRQAVRTLNEIAGRCDGVRCDMAMLLLTEVFAKTWGALAGVPPAREFWAEVIGEVRAAHPGFLFIAEAYWDREWDLQQLGFDYCYDKRLYDRLRHDGGESIRQHLWAEWNYQRRLLRFLENHDEPRVLSAFGEARAGAAAVLLFTLPGATMVFAGQMQGAGVQTPIQLARVPLEPVRTDLEARYRRLLSVRPAPGGEEAVWSLCETHAFSPSTANPLIAHRWTQAGKSWLTVVNYGAEPVRGTVKVPWLAPGPALWSFTDLLSGQRYGYPGGNLRTYGLYVELPAWGSHVFLTVPGT